MRALRLNIDRIQERARRDEQAVSLAAAKADIRAGFGKFDLTDPRTIGREDLHAVIAVANPARADPDVALGVDPHAVGESRLAVERHVDQGARVRELVAVEIVLPDDVLGVGVMRDAGVADIDLLVVVAEGDAVRLERFVGYFCHLTALGSEPVYRLLLVRLVRAGIGLLSLINA